MLRRVFPVLVFFAALSALYGQSPAGPLPQLDGAVKGLGAEINARLSAGGAEKVSLGQWTYRNSVPALGAYWQLQLMEELTNIPGRSFSLVPAAQAGADWTISGEIIHIAGVVRVYTRFLKTAGNSITAILHSDFEYSQHFSEMLGGVSSSSSSSSSGGDPYENDSWDAPYFMEIASGADNPGISRTLHDGGDEDFFLLTPDRDGSLVMETTGGVDTYMELYRADSRESIDDDDDDGSGSNARIRRDVRAGDRYIVKIRGYSGDTGNYVFHAYIPGSTPPDEWEEDNSFETARDIGIGAAQQHSFHSGRDDVDWVKFRVTSPGRYTIRAQGRSTRLDTYIELWDSERNNLDEDDDGGDALDSRLSVQLQPGLYYLKVECINDESDRTYTIRVDSE
jgi:hypothetical protein